MALFTIIAEYRGGTYVAQHRAVTPIRALARWAEQFPTIQGSFIGPKNKLKLQAAVAIPDDKPIPIDGTDGVWFWHSTAIAPSIWVHIVRTESDK